MQAGISGATQVGGQLAAGASQIGTGLAGDIGQVAGGVCPLLEAQHGIFII